MQARCIFQTDALFRCPGAIYPFIEEVVYARDCDYTFVGIQIMLFPYLM